MKSPLRRTIAVIALTAFLAFLIILFNFNPENSGFYPVCPSKLITGYDCPGCGSLRAMHALMHGKVAAAWHFNPAIFFAFIALALLAVAGIHRSPIASKMPERVLVMSGKTARLTDSPLFPLSILILVVVWTIVRNIL